MTKRKWGEQFWSARVKTQPVASNLRALCWRPRNEVGMVMWADHAGLVLFLVRPKAGGIYCPQAAVKGYGCAGLVVLGNFKQ